MAEWAVYALVVVSIVVTALGSSRYAVVRDPAYGARFVILGVLALAAAAGARGTPRDIARRVASPWLLGWVALLALAFASATWSPDGETSTLRAVTLVLLVLALAATLAFADSRRRIEALATSVAVGILVVFALSLVVLVGSSDHGFQPAFTSDDGGSVRRFRGITENPNTLGSYGFVALPLLLWLAAAARGRSRVVWCVGAVACVVLVTLSTSRLPIVLMALQAIAYVAVAERRRRVRAAVVVASLLAVAAVAVTAAAWPDFRDRVVRVDKIATASGRTEAWRGGLELVERRPLHGYGWGMEATVFGEYRLEHHEEFQEVGFAADSIHNSYLSLAVQAGIGATLLVGILLAWPIAVLARDRVRAALGRPLATALILVLAGVAANGMFSSHFSSVGNVITVSLWLLAAVPVATLGWARPADG